MLEDMELFSVKQKCEKNEDTDYTEEAKTLTLLTTQVCTGAAECGPMNAVG